MKQSFTIAEATRADGLSKLRPKRLNQSGLIPLLLGILVVVLGVIYLAYLRVQGA